MAIHRTRRSWLLLVLSASVGCSGPKSSAPDQTAKPGDSGGPTREQAAQSGENMSKIAVAVLNYDAKKNEFPARFFKTKDGLPGLSWRVAILPYLGEGPLFQRFHLDEAWDSPNNKPLVAEMPAVFKSPVAHAQPGYTNYLGIETNLSALIPNRGPALAGFRDGISNTILFVEANDDRAVPWTKPADYIPDTANPLSGLGKLHPQGAMLIACVDSQVHLLKSSLDPKTFIALTTRHGGEVVDWESIRFAP